MTTTDILPAVFWNTDPCPPSAVHWNSWKSSFFEYLGKLAEIHPDAVIDESTRLVLFRMNLGKQGQKYFDAFEFRKLTSLSEACGVLERLLGYSPPLEYSSDEESDESSFFPYLPTHIVQVPLASDPNVSSVDHDDAHTGSTIDENPAVHTPATSYDDIPISDVYEISSDAPSVIPSLHEDSFGTVTVLILQGPVHLDTDDESKKLSPKWLVPRPITTYNHSSASVTFYRNSIVRMVTRRGKTDDTVCEFDYETSVSSLIQFSKRQNNQMSVIKNPSANADDYLFNCVRPPDSLRRRS